MVGGFDHMAWFDGFFGGGCFAVFGRDVAVSARVGALGATRHALDRNKAHWQQRRAPSTRSTQGCRVTAIIDVAAGATVIGKGRERARLGGAGFFTNAGGILLAVDSVSQSWVLTACMSWLHTNHGICLRLPSSSSQANQA